MQLLKNKILVLESKIGHAYASGNDDHLQLVKELKDDLQEANVRFQLF